MQFADVTMELEPMFHQARVTYTGQEFTDRLSYLDKRYDHLRKNMQALKKKIHELEDVMLHDNDEENMVLINEIIEEIKVEKLKLRDEASIIRGELSQAMTKESLKKIWNGDHRREQRIREEREEKERKEREVQEEEERAYREKEDIERQRKEAKERLLHGVLAGAMAAHSRENDAHAEPGCSAGYQQGFHASPSNLSQNNNGRVMDSGYGGYESEYDNEPSTLSKSTHTVSKNINYSRSADFHNGKVYPVGQKPVNGYAHAPAVNPVHQILNGLSLTELDDSRNSEDSGFVHDDIDDSPRPTMLCFGKWGSKGSKLTINKHVKETEV